MAEKITGARNSLDLGIPLLLLPSELMIPMTRLLAQLLQTIAPTQQKPPTTAPTEQLPQM